MNAPSAAVLTPGRDTAKPALTAHTIPTRLVVATVAGNALEFYDFGAYAFFATYIGKAFFPLSTPMGSLLASVAVFGVGFVTRPIGGVLIGAYADRAGRRPAMLLTITLITLGTLGLALTPTYASIGIAAPIIVVLCRLIQGLALGGEVGPSTAFLVEAAPRQRRGYFASWQLASQGAATLCAGLLGVLIMQVLGTQAVQDWAWRLPFALGLLLLPVALYLRNNMPETLEATPLGHHQTGMTGLVNRRRTIGLAILVVLGGTVSTYVGNFMTTYAMTTLKFPPAVAMGATVMIGLVTLVFSPIGGWLSDRIGRRPVMLWPRVAAALLTVPAFMLLLSAPSAAMLLAVASFLAMLTAVSGGASLAAIPELLPRGIRATGLSIAYAIGVALFGGSTQFVITWLMKVTGNPVAPAWYVTVASVITALAMMALPESRATELED